MATVAVATEGVGNSQYSMELPPNHVLMIRTGNGDYVEFRDQPVEMLIAPILQYKGEIMIRGASIPYICSLNAKPKPGQVMNSFERVLTSELRRAVHNSFRNRAAGLIVQFQGENTIMFEVSYKDRIYTCRVTLTDK